MNNTPVQREYFFDSIRAADAIGYPFSHFAHLLQPQLACEQRRALWWLTLFNDFIHAFRMQVFFVISGYFSYMLFCAIR